MNSETISCSFFKNTVLLICLLIVCGCGDNSPTGTDSGKKPPTENNGGGDNNDNQGGNGKGDDGTNESGLKVYEGSKVELEINNPYDFIYVYVNDIWKKTWRINTPNPGRIDITDWLGGEPDMLRFTAVNDGGTFNYGYKLFVDGKLAYQANCANKNCADESNRSKEHGIYDVDTVIVKAKGRQSAKVTINSPAGDLYINNHYTGFETPKILELPYGDYTIGIGTNGPKPAYYESAISVNNQTEEVNLDKKDIVPTKDWKMALLPIRYTQHGSNSPENIAVIKDSNIDDVEQVLKQTNSQLLHPYSYNLVNWDLTRLPVVEKDTLHRGAKSGNVPNTNRLLKDAGLQKLKDEYDTIVFYYGHKRANGQNVANMPCCGWGGGKNMIMTFYGANFHNQGWLHEWLHGASSYHTYFRYHEYAGIGKLHGAKRHGYRKNMGGSSDWTYWPRHYMRSQVKETMAMSNAIKEFPSPPPVGKPPLYTGIFYTIRYGADGPLPFPSLEKQKTHQKIFTGDGSYKRLPMRR